MDANVTNARLFLVAFIVGAVVLALAGPVSFLAAFAFPGAILMVFTTFVFPFEVFHGSYGEDFEYRWLTMMIAAVWNGLVYGGVALGVRAAVRNIR